MCLGMLLKKTDKRDVFMKFNLVKAERRKWKRQEKRYY